MACGQGGSLDVEPAGESRRDCRGTCQATCAQNSTRSAEPALSRGYERALKLVNPGNRPLDAVRRSSLRLFGPRTYTDGLPIVESRTGAVAWAMRQRSVSRPRSSNRTCGFVG